MSDIDDTKASGDSVSVLSDVKKRFSGIKKPKFSFKKLKKLNKNFYLAGGLAVLLIIIGITALLITKDKKVDTPEEVVNTAITDPATEQTAKITLKEGTLEIKKDGEWVNATFEDVVGSSTALKTVGAASRAEITIEDGSVVRLDANTEIEFEYLTLNRIFIRQLTGYVYNRVTSSATRTYIVSTEDAQFEAAGTAFRTINSGDEQAVEIYQSSVHETSTNKKPVEGEKLIVVSKSSPAKNKTIEKLDIEILKADTFLMWNRQLDESNNVFKNSLGFLKDIDGPEINITDPLENSTVFVEPTDTEGVVEIKGTTEKGTTLTVQSKSVAGSQALPVTVGDDGTFSTPVLTAPLGSSVFEFIGKDRIGNKTTKNIRISFQRKSQPVESPKISLSVTITGTKADLSWGYSGGLSAPDGVKIMYKNDDNPSFPGDVNGFEPSDSEHTINGLTVGKEYHFQVCVYDATEDDCTVYSNVVIKST